MQSSHLYAASRTLAQKTSFISKPVLGICSSLQENLGLSIQGKGANELEIYCSEAMGVGGQINQIADFPPSFEAC